MSLFVKSSELAEAKKLAKANISDCDRVLQFLSEPRRAVAVAIELQKPCGYTDILLWEMEGAGLTRFVGDRWEVVKK